MPWTRLAVVSVIALLGAAGIYWAVAPTITDWFGLDRATIRYRMTVSATVDGKPVSASAVQELDVWAEFTPVTNFGRTSTRIYGEAVLLPVNGGAALLVLLYGEHDIEDAWDKQMLHACNINGLTPHDVVAAARAFGGPCVLAPEAHPLVISMANQSDPNTVLKVMPPTDATIGGHHVHIDKITLAATNDPPANDIVRALPWLARSGYGNIYGGLGVADTPNGLPLYRSAFYSLRMN